MTMTKKNVVSVYYLEPSDDMLDDETARSVRFNANEDAIRDAVAKGLYKLAAKVFDINSSFQVEQMLDKAYISTNSIHQSWTENANVKCITERPRSCSVGDVMELNGDFYAVSPVGFKKLDDFSIEVKKVSRHERDDLSAGM